MAVSQQCSMCGAEVSSSAEVVVCSEACEEQLWWVLSKGPPFGSAVSGPRNDVGAKRQKKR